MAENILEVNNLTTRFRTERGLVTAVQGVSFHVRRGEILGLVGESGCGKSVTSQTIMRLYDEKRLAPTRVRSFLKGKTFSASRRSRCRPCAAERSPWSSRTV